MPRKNCQSCKTNKIEYRLYLDHGAAVTPAGSCYAKLATLKAAQVCLACAVETLKDGRAFNIRKILRADLNTKRDDLPTSVSACVLCGYETDKLSKRRACSLCEDREQETGKRSSIPAPDSGSDDLGF